MSEQSTLPEHDHFTIVFEGNLRDFDRNPFLTDTPFGLPRVVGVGNAFNEFDQFCAVRDELLKTIRDTRALVAEGADSGFTDHGWMDRLFQNQQRLTAAIALAEAAA